MLNSVNQVQQPQVLPSTPKQNQVQPQPIGRYVGPAPGYKEDQASLGDKLKSGIQSSVPILAGGVGGGLVGMASVTSAANATAYFGGVGLMGVLPGMVGAVTAQAVGDEQNGVMAGLGTGAATGAIVVGAMSKSAQGAFVGALIGGAAGAIGATVTQFFKD